MRGADTQTTNRAHSLRRHKTSPRQDSGKRCATARSANINFCPAGTDRPYFADFCCRERKLIIELDGATHSTDVERARDAKRTRFLESQNYRVIRFTNADVYSDLESVTNTILAALGEPW
ncbi:MAG: hypothetical protein QOF41_2401 [Methylobacteriaceae bacterium]|nr:hypothetical protein [Methylobacteriaceae bacterium]